MNKDLISELVYWKLTRANEIFGKMLPALTKHLKEKHDLIIGGIYDGLQKYMDNPEGTQESTVKSVPVE